MGKIISLSNQKGGVGKTTSTINLGAYLAEAGKRVLLVDIDPQANATSGLGIDSKKNDKTVYQVLIGAVSARDAILPTKIENLSLLPSHIDLAAAEIDLLDAEHKEFKLKTQLENIRDFYDYILIDCPPSLGILTLNALLAANSVMVILQCEYYALEGLTQLMNIINKVQKQLNTNLALEGVLLTMFDGKTNLSKQVRDDVTEFFKDKVFNAIIPRNVKLSEAPSFGIPIGQYDAKSSGAVAYRQFAQELIERNKEQG